MEVSDHEKELAQALVLEFGCAVALVKHHASICG